jgi:rhodanese-related sulfurtransferase
MLLVGALTLLGLVVVPTASAQAEAKRLTPDELKAIIDKKEKFFFLDVREPKEIEMLGTMRGYVNIPLSELEARLSEVPKGTFIVTA